MTSFDVNNTLFQNTILDQYRNFDLDKRSSKKMSKTRLDVQISASQQRNEETLKHFKAGIKTQDEIFAAKRTKKPKTAANPTR